MKSINRILARPFTRVFIKSGFHPNYITLLSAAAGLSSCIAFCFGAKSTYILGAALFELFYILDNCDGEVARAKGLSSKFGSWLDTMTDYLVHVLAFGAIALGLYRVHQETSTLILGAAAMFGVFLSFLVVVLQKRRNYGLAVHGMPKAPEGAVKKTGPFDRLIDALSVGDFSIVVLVFAIFNGMELLLWLAAFGANIFWIILLATNVKYLTNRDVG